MPLWYRNLEAAHVNSRAAVYKKCIGVIGICVGGHYSVSAAKIDTISPRPLLFIAGGKAISRYFSEDAYSKAAEPKELLIVPGATLVDLYDQPEYLQITLPDLDKLAEMTDAKPLDLFFRYPPRVASLFANKRGRKSVFRLNFTNFEGVTKTSGTVTRWLNITT